MIIPGLFCSIINIVYMFMANCMFLVWDFKLGVDSSDGVDKLRGQSTETLIQVLRSMRDDLLYMKKENELLRLYNISWSQLYERTYFKPDSTKDANKNEGQPPNQQINKPITNVVVPADDHLKRLEEKQTVFDK